MNMCNCTHLPIRDSCASLCLSIPACACHFSVACLSLLPVSVIPKVLSIQFFLNRLHSLPQVRRCKSTRGGTSKEWYWVQYEDKDMR